jgi:hypothetical protein
MPFLFLGDEMAQKLFALIGGLILIIGTCFSVSFYFEARSAHAEDIMKVIEVMKKMGTRLDLHIIEGELRIVQQKINTIEDRYCTDKAKPCTEEKMPQTVRDQYRELKLEKIKLEDEFKALKDERAKAKVK